VLAAHRPSRGTKSAQARGGRIRVRAVPGTVRAPRPAVARLNIAPRRSDDLIGADLSATARWMASLERSGAWVPPRADPRA